MNEERFGEVPWGANFSCALLLPVTIKDWSDCLHKHFELPPPPDGLTREDVVERRQRVSETLDQLELLDREVDDMLGALEANAI